MANALSNSPPVIHNEQVRPEWIDANGHMNVAFYMMAFDRATDAFLQLLDLGTQYRADTGDSTFTVESHITFQREVMLGDPLALTAQLLAYDRKRLHYVHCLYQANAGYLAATCEFLLLSVNLADRRVVSLPTAALTRLGDMQRTHASWPVPEQIGRSIRINQPLRPASAG